MWKSRIKILSRFYLKYGIILLRININMLNTFTHLFQLLIHNLENIVRHGGYSVLFLVSFIEALPIIGQFVPGHTIVIFSGFLSKIGILNIYYTIPLIIIGAFSGDILSYYFGKKFGFAFLTKFGKYFFIKDSHIERAKELINRHSKKTIILGRFSPITRPLTPFIVGASGIHDKHFWTYSFIGVILWTFFSVMIGYIFGASYHIIEGVFGKFVLIAIIISLLILWGFKFVNKQFHIFAKYELITLILNISSLYIFFKIVQDAIGIKTYLTELDVWVNIFFSSKANGYMLFIMDFLTNIFSPKNIILYSLICLVYLLFRKKWRYALITFTSVAGGSFMGIFLKELIMRSRPLNGYINELGYSFPSGHSISMAIFSTLIVYFFAKEIKTLYRREAFITFFILLTIVAGFSRVYLGVHWLTDVIAGISFGLFWTTLMILLVRYLSVLLINFIDALKSK